MVKGLPEEAGFPPVVGLIPPGDTALDCSAVRFLPAAPKSREAGDG